MLTCSVCGASKSEDAFYWRAPGVPRRDCKECVKARITRSPSKQRRAAEAAARKAARKPFDPVAYKARWYRDNKERLAPSSKQWAKDHPEQMRAYRSKWQKSNPANGQKTSQTHRARKLSSAVDIPNRDWARLIQRYKGMCAYCGVRPYEHQDHVLPLSRGGRHSIGNVLPVCAPCNQGKSARTLMEWRRVTC